MESPVPVLATVRTHDEQALKHTPKDFGASHNTHNKFREALSRLTFCKMIHVISMMALRVIPPFAFLARAGRASPLPDTPGV